MRSPNRMVECCIIGSGPAGLQAGYLLGQKNIDFCILEKAGAVADFFRHFPRHRKLISINKPMTGLSNPDTRLRYDWNSLLNSENHRFTDVSSTYFPDADDYVGYLEDFAAQIKDNIRLNCDVTRISKDDGVFMLECGDGVQVCAHRIIVATGFTKPWVPNVEGIETVDNYFDCDLAPENYAGKRVLIIGKGNSAFETADALSEHTQATHVISPDKIRFAWQSHFVGHLRAVNNNFLDTYQLKSQNAVLDGDIYKIERHDGVYTVHAKMQAAQNHVIILEYDKIIACTGFRFNADIFDADIRPALHYCDKLPKMTNQWESETTPDLFFAGTIMQSRDFHKTMSGFVHGFRHNVACLSEFIAQRLTGQSYPDSPVELTRTAIERLILNRVSLSSGMFLQPGFLGDAIMLTGPRAGTTLSDVPVDWMQSEPAIIRNEHLMITLEFGDFGDNALHVKRQHNVAGEAPDAFIHPVIRHFKGGKLVGQAHLADHLDADWRPMKDRDAGVGTVQRMTFCDAGQPLAPSDVALGQIRQFFDKQGLFAIVSPDAISAELAKVS